MAVDFGGAARSILRGLGHAVLLMIIAEDFLCGCSRSAASSLGRISSFRNVRCCRRNFPDSDRVNLRSMGVPAVFLLRMAGQSKFLIQLLYRENIGIVVVVVFVMAPL